MSSFDWDATKAQANERAHGVSFAEADEVALSPLAVEVPDLEHSDLELRLRITGWSNSGRILVVVVSLGGPRPRIISARRATKRERNEYVG